MKRLLISMLALVAVAVPCRAQSDKARKAMERLRKQATVELDVKVPMRDGLKLTIDIARPKRAGKYPVVYSLTPYRKNILHAGGLVRDGYVVASQDVRGTGNSEGAFFPFKHDGKDAHDTIEWLAKQPWCDGNVGMIGGSYVGFTQLAAAIERPPHLKCIMPAVPPTDFGGRSIFNGGAMRMGIARGWLLGQSWNSQRVRRGLVPKDELERWKPYRKAESAWRLLPLSDPGPIAVGGPTFAECWNNYIASWEDPEFWIDASPLHHVERIQVPTLILAGYYDIFTQENIELLQALREKGGSPAAREHSHIMIGPWPHGLGRPAGDVDFKKARSALDGLRERWLARWLKGKRNDVDSWKAIYAFTMGRGTWMSLDTWPPPNSKPMKMYLVPRALSIKPPADGVEPSTFTYDPDNPVPTLGGNNLMLPSGIRDHKPNAERDDVLSFVGPAFEKDTVIAGRMSVHLFVSTTAPDTDFTAMLLDVRPDGYRANVQDGIIRLRYRESREKPKLVKPGEIVEVDIDLWSTAYTFKAGHRPALHISSSNFPRFDRNLNSAKAPYAWTIPAKADNTVYHDAEHPSYLEVQTLK